MELIASTYCFFSNNFTKVKSLGLYIVLFILIIASARAQVQYSIQIVDQQNNPLSYTSVKCQAAKNTFYTSDSLGYVTFKANAFTLLEISRIGFLKKLIILQAQADTSFQLNLIENNTLNEVVVTDTKFLKSSSSSSNGIITINKNTLDALPNIGGEKDILKAIQLLPGVQSGNEGTRGIFIRGGSPDQTLILLDRTPVYNVTHLYGFMSVFNGESIDKVDLYKNDFPARFGGRLGAVISIGSNFGNSQKIKTSITIGLLSTRIAIDGPIGKNKKTTFSIAARGSYVGLYAKPISAMQFKRAGYGGSISYNFYDMNIAFTHRFSEKDLIKFSSFYSHDIFHFKKDKNESDKINNAWQYIYHYSNKVNWNNNTATLQWQHQVNTNLSSCLLAYISNYTLNSNFNQEETEYRNQLIVDRSLKKYTNQNFVREYAIRNEWSYDFQNNHLLVGAQITYKPYQIGNGKYQRDRLNKANIDTTYTNTLNKTLENTIFIENEFKIHSKVLLNIGFHVVHYLYKSSNFFSFQPRMNLLYTPNKNWVFRTSFITSTQNIHLLTSGSSIVLTDLWVPATKKLLPENVWQVSGGIQLNFSKQFECSVDAYYKKMNNVIEYKNGVSKILIGDSWENQIIGGGKGEAYGAEFFVSKTKGKFTAWAKYNLGWTTRQFSELNQGNKYFYKYDRRHDVSIVLAYKLNRHFDFSLNWVYASGNWISLWKSQYPSQYSIDYYDFTNGDTQYPYIISNKERNNYRLPAYHHLDIGFNYTKQDKKVTHILNVSIYNIYNHFNVFDVYSDRRYDKNGNAYNVTKSLTLFPFVPSITYTIKL